MESVNPVGGTREVRELAAVDDGPSDVASTSYDTSPDKPKKGNLKDVVVEFHEPTGKGGKKKRRRARLLILFEDSQERRRWWPWVMLAILLAVAIVGVVLVLRFTLGNDNSNGASQSARTLRSGEVDVRKFADCNELVSRLKDASTKVSLGYSENSLHYNPTTRRSRWFEADQPWVDKASRNIEGGSVIEGGSRALQHDMLVPAQTDASASDAQIAYGPDYLYAAAGSQLLVLQPHRAFANESAVVNRVDLLAFDAAPAAARRPLVLTNAEDADKQPYEVPYGLHGTFRALQLIMPPHAAPDGPGTPRVLVVIGTAIDAAGIEGAEHATPHIMPGPNPPVDYTANLAANGFQYMYVGTEMRPFLTTVAIFLDIADPARPALLGAAEFEGFFITAQMSPDYEMLFMTFRHATHEPYARAKGATATQYDETVMPLYRYRPLSGDAAALPSWKTIGGCTSVDMIETRGDPAYAKESQMVTTVALPLAPAGGRRVGEPDEAHVSSVAVAWQQEAEGIVMSAQHMFIAEAKYLGSTSPLGGSSTSVAPSASSTSQAQFTTAIASYELTPGGAIVHRNKTLQSGELLFRGAMEYDVEYDTLKALSTVKYDEQLMDSSLMTLYTKDLVALQNFTRLFPEREPTTIFHGATDYSSAIDMKGRRHAYVALPYANPPQIHMLEYTLRKPEEAAAEALPPAGSGGRLFLKEHVQLMKVFVLGPQRKEFLLVAGRPSSAAASLDAGASSSTDVTSQRNGFQFSIYSADDINGSDDAKPVVTQSITASDMVSEALYDQRAARLFNSAEDPDNEASIFFAMPVDIEDAEPLMRQLGCPRGATHLDGAMVWRILWNPAAPRNVQVESLGTVPAKSGCGAGDASHSGSCAPKRIRFIDSASQGKTALVLASASTVSVVDWSAALTAHLAGMATAPGDAAAAQLVPPLLNRVYQSPMFAPVDAGPTVPGTCAAPGMCSCDLSI